MTKNHIMTRAFLLVATASSFATNNNAFVQAENSIPSSSTSGTAERNLATLAEKWNITEPTFDYDGLEFDLDYAVSDYIAQGMFDFGIYDQECKEGEYPIPQSILSFTPNTLPNNKLDGSGRRVVEVKININPEEITSDPKIYEETTIGGQLFAIVTFCVRLNLNTGGDSSIEVNFQETLVTLNVDLTDGFEIGTVAVAPKEKLVKTANQAYEVEGYMCNINYTPLTDGSTVRNQGAIIRVCVQPTLEAREDGIYMREINSFDFSRTYADPNKPAVTQVAVRDSQAADNGLTDLFCKPGWEICMFETILFASFYRDNGEVLGSGIASMQFGGSGRDVVFPEPGRRLLRGEENDSSNRFLQEDEAAAVAEFELSFDTVRAEDAPTSSAAITTVGICTSSIVSLFFVVAAMMF